MSGRDSARPSSSPYERTTIVAEISRNWQGDRREGHIGNDFERVIQHNLERGYLLRDWHYCTSAVGGPWPHLNETIVAVFERDDPGTMQPGGFDVRELVLRVAVDAAIDAHTEGRVYRDGGERAAEHDRIVARVEKRVRAALEREGLV